MPGVTVTISVVLWGWGSPQTFSGIEVLEFMATEKFTDKLTARRITNLHLYVPYFLEKTKSICQLKESSQPFLCRRDILGKAVLLSCSLIKKLAATKAQHFLETVIGFKRGFCGMLVQFIHGSVSSGFFSYYFSRPPIGGENVTQIDYDALTSEKSSPFLFFKKIHQ